MSDTPGPAIAIFLTGDFPEGKAANSRIKAIAKGLVSAGYSPELIYLWASDFNNSGINTCEKGEWEGIPYRYINGSCKRPRYVTGKLFDSIKGIVNSGFYLFRHRRRIAITYVYSGELSAFFNVYLASKLSRIPVIVERTELRSSYPFKRLSALSRQLFRADEKLIRYFCDHLLVVSEKLLVHYRKLERRGKLSMLPVITDMGRFKRNEIVSRKGLIGYIGTFGTKDRVPQIIEAFRLARLKRDDLHLRLIGYGGENQNIKKQIEQVGLTGHVTITGQVAYDEVPVLLQECDLLVMNRDHSDYSAFGSPAKVGEYLASGVPAIITRVGDIGNYLQHEKDAYLIPPGITAKLAEAILERYAQYDKFTAMGQQGRSTCEKCFSVEANIPKLKEVVENLRKKYPGR
jgi:glycosyltransferase involved in cell wall biosynthesis